VGIRIGLVEGLFTLIGTSFVSLVSLCNSSYVRSASNDTDELTYLVCDVYKLISLVFQN
jgi:hypothetical protein